MYQSMRLDRRRLCEGGHAKRVFLRFVIISVFLFWATQNLNRAEVRPVRFFSRVRFDGNRVSCPVETDLAKPLSEAK